MTKLSCISKKNDYKIELNENAYQSLEARVASHFRRKIHSGELKSGDILPKCESINGVSHVSVIAAYKRLSKEGLVKSIRSKGTVVLKNCNSTCYGIMISNHNSLYGMYLIDAFFKEGKYRGNSPQILFLPPDSVESVKNNAISSQLHNAVESGIIRGIFTPHHMKKNIEWLRTQGVPTVCGFLDKQNEFVTIDFNKLIEKGVNLLSRKKCKKIYVYSTNIDITPETIECGNFSNDKAGDPEVILSKVNYIQNSYDAVALGKKIVEDISREGKFKPENGFIFVDDFVASAAIIKCKELGISPTKDANILVVTYKGQMNALLSEIDQVLIDLRDYAKEAVDQIERIIEAKGTDKVVTPKYFSKAKIVQHNNH